MAHLTCELHKRRALVLNGGPGLRRSHIIHREDGTRCGDIQNDFVKYRGHTLSTFNILGGRIPKFQAPTRKQFLEKLPNQQLAESKENADKLLTEAERLLCLIFSTSMNDSDSAPSAASN